MFELDKNILDKFALYATDLSDDALDGLASVIYRERVRRFVDAINLGTHALTAEEYELRQSQGLSQARDAYVLRVGENSLLAFSTALRIYEEGLSSEKTDPDSNAAILEDS